MTTAAETIQAHYRMTGLKDRLREALKVFGSEDQQLTIQQLAPIDQFHTRGIAATADLAEMTNLGAGMTVLDIGSGVGGPARFLAAKYGCKVVGIDLSADYVDAATYLTQRSGQAAQVEFQVADALDVPFEDASFDAVFLQHVAMNIADRARLYGEISRLLKPGGRFATYDVVASGSELYYPVPWAKTAATSFLLTESDTRRLLNDAGFVPLAWKDDSQTARDWFAMLKANGPPPGPNLAIIIGADFEQVTTNLARNIAEGRVGILSAILEVSRHS